jgi:endoglucanase
MKQLVVRLSLALAVLAFTGSLFAQTPPAGSPVAAHGRLSVSGGRIVDKNGDPVQLRGMSFFWSNAPEARDFYNANVVKWLADDWKVSVVRAAMGVEKDFWSGQEGYLNAPDANKTRVTNVVNGAVANGIYVIIDWHSYEAHTPQDRVTRAVAFFEDMARAYKDVPNVIYEIYNEPIGSSANPQETWSNIKPYMQTVTNAIRAIDPNNIIIIGTPYYSQRVDVAVDDPVQGANLAYALHFYAGEAAHRATLRNYAYYAMTEKNQAVFVTEFGATGASGDGNYNEAQTDIWLAFMDQFKISWANWSINTKNELSAALKSGASTSGNWNSGNLTTSGAYIRDKLRSPPVAEKSFFTLTVSTVGEGAVQQSATNLIHYKGLNITLISRPAEGWKLAGWSGDISGGDATVSVTMNGDKAVTATFEPVSTSALPPGAGAAVTRWSVRRSGGGVTLAGPPSGGPAEVALYDTRGKQVGRYMYRGDQPAIINNIKVPAGNYLMVVRSASSGKEIFKARVSLVD